MQKTLKAGSRITLRDQLQLMMQIELLNVVFMMNFKLRALTGKCVMSYVRLLTCWPLQLPEKVGSGSHSTARHRSWTRIATAGKLLWNSPESSPVIALAYVPIR
ncbi:hypothetical protein F3P14_24055 (plasmid) [Escherichia coli]|nr:hypothetical protein F3P14_24055 [Escherichia coli]